MTLINNPMLILSTAKQHCVRTIAVFFLSTEFAVIVMQTLTGSSRYHSSINMYLHKLKYSSVFTHFEAYLH